jgi:hypothetical protein
VLMRVASSLRVPGPTFSHTQHKVLGNRERLFCYYSSIMGKRNVLEPNDHWVSQWLLRNFEIPGMPGNIFVYSRTLEHLSMRNPARRGIRRIACERGFNTLTSRDGSLVTAGLEKIFHNHEDRAVPIVRKLNTNDEVILSEQDRRDLATYVAVLIFANPRGRKQQRVLLANKDEFLEHTARDREELIEGYVRKHPEWPDARERITKALDDPEASYKELTTEPKTTIALTPFELAYEFAEKLIKRQWQLVIADGSKSFIIADHPVVALPPTDYSGDWEDNYFACPQVLPISPTRCLQVIESARPDEVMRVGADAVDLVNKYSMFFAENEVYSHRESGEIARAFSSTDEAASKKAFRVYV